MHEQLSSGPRYMNFELSLSLLPYLFMQVVKSLYRLSICACLAEPWILLMPKVPKWKCCGVVDKPLTLETRSHGFDPWLH